MHDIEPYYKWRDYYIASEDESSPFYGRTYNEFQYTQKIYNYFIHPQWDFMGSPTLYIKILYVDYLQGYSIIELIGEWNDAVTNDIMYLKREIADRLMKHGIHKFILLCDHVLNFHGEDDDYYQEWAEDVREENGWVCLVNIREHIYREMQEMRLEDYVAIPDELDEFEWRQLKPETLYRKVMQEVQL